MNSIYSINKGINKSIEFKGLKAQYIWYLGAGVFVLLILYGIMYFLGFPSLVCVIITLLSGGVLIYKIYGMSNKYGEYGLLKAGARRSIPRVLKVQNREIFTRLNAPDKYGKLSFLKKSSF
jgi:hypothetical protein